MPVRETHGKEQYDDIKNSKRHLKFFVDFADYAYLEIWLWG